MIDDWRRYRALTFDCYGTLIDWETGLTAVLRPWAAQRGLALDAEALLAAFAEAEAAIEAAQPTLPYPDVLRGALDGMAQRFGVPADRAAADAVARSIRDWPAFPDSPAALAYLKQHYRLAIVSNVDRGSFVHSNRKLGVTFDAVVTAEDVGAYKPNPAHFHEALRRLAELGVARDEILHVAQSLYHDHATAKQLGLATVWINRRQGKAGWGATRPPALPVTPNAEFPSLGALAEAHRRMLDG